MDMNIFAERLKRERARWTAVRLATLASQMRLDEDAVLRAIRTLRLPLSKRNGEWWLNGTGRSA
jgi:hypothetical protein